jgi:hypothetical protein
MGRCVNLSSDIVECRHDMISSIVLKEYSRDTTETGNANRISRAFACSCIIRKLKYLSVGIVLQAFVLFHLYRLIKL